MEPAQKKPEVVLATDPARLLNAAGFRAAYYRNIMPLDLVFEWMIHGEEPWWLKRREISFQREIRGTYYRFESYESADAFRQKLLQNNPVKIDLGGFYQTALRFRDKDHGEVVRKEFVIDIDLTDYDSVRTCCQDDGACQKCWKFVTMAVRILHQFFQEFMCFKDILWVFSGRRGVHCWVGDPAVQKWSDEERESFVEMLQFSSVFRKSEDDAPFLDRVTAAALEIIEKDFLKDILEEQDIWSKEKGWDEGDIVRNLPNEELRSEILSTIHRTEGNTFEKWLAVERAIKEKFLAFEYLLWELMLSLGAPRLDRAVSVSRSHLLKLPFSVHPQTQKIAVPFDPLDTLQLSQVPTVSDVVTALREGSPRVLLEPYIAAMRLSIEASKA